MRFAPAREAHCDATRKTGGQQILRAAQGTAKAQPLILDGLCHFMPVSRHTPGTHGYTRKVRYQNDIRRV
jgi:hypothetical protein